MSAGRLVLVATPIGNLGDISPRALETLESADLVACEDTRVTRRLLSATGMSTPRLMAVHEHNEAASIDRIAAAIEAGQVVALVTDAGMPGVSDPGSRIVAGVAARGCEIRVVPGPSAALAAVVISGLPTDRFTFEGFLPRKGAERKARLAEIARDRRTVVLFESPRRVGATLGALVEACGPDRRVAVARELTKVHEEVWRGRLADAAARAEAAEPRGEHVLVIEGAPAPDEATDADIADALASRRAAGDDRRSAVAAVAAELGVPKRRVYDLALSSSD